jgi:membrane protease YdiL (CAAX protease family)
MEPNLDVPERATPDQMNLLRRQPILTTIGVVVALLASVAIGVAVLVASGHQDLAESRYQWPALIGYILLGAVIVGLCWRSNSWRSVGLKSPARWWPYAPIPLILALHLAETNDLQIIPSGGLIVLLCSFALLIGFVEELLFRGLILTLYNKLVVAVAVSTLVFGLIHASRAFGATSQFETVLTIIFALVWGLFAALTYLAGGSILPLILLHWFWDWWSLMDTGPQHNALLVASTGVMLAWSVVLAMWVQRNPALADEMRQSS